MIFNKILSKLFLYNNQLRCINLRCLRSVQTQSTEQLDIKNIEKLESLANDWWNPNGIFRPLHSMNEIRVPLIREGLISTGKISKDLWNTPNVLTGLNILEVGCGGGILTEQLGRLNGKITGVDPSAELIRTAQEHLTNKSPELSCNITYKSETIQDHCKLNKVKYDAVVISEVLEHVVDKEIFLDSCIETLKTDGSIFITTINKTNMAYWAAIVVAEKILKLLPENTHDWNNFISPTDVQRILEKYGCQVILVNGIFYEFWRNAWRYVSSTDVNYMLHAVKN